MPHTTSARTALSDPVSVELRQVLRSLRLGRMLDTLPDRLTLARQQQTPHADFLELVLADEVTRRETNSAALRARAAGLDPAMRLDTWDTTAAVRFDQQLGNQLTSLRLLDAAHGALVLGPVGVGKTHQATALCHIAVRRRYTVHMTRADKLFKRLKAARLDNSVEAEMRRLAHVQLLIVDDFCLQSLDATETADFYEICVERHQQNSTIITSNREPNGFDTIMPKTLATATVDRLLHHAHLIITQGRFAPAAAGPRRQGGDSLDITPTEITWPSARNSAVRPPGSSQDRRTGLRPDPRHDFQI
jgi:DNA replication protein DnaC